MDLHPVIQPGQLCAVNLAAIGLQSSHIFRTALTCRMCINTHCLAELVVMANGNFFYTIWSQYENRMIFDRWLLHSCKKNGVVVFAADSDLQLAAKCDTLIGDATFSTSPKGFRQLYTLHAKAQLSYYWHTIFCILWIRFQCVNVSGDAEWIVVAFALMNIKSQSAYESVFNALQSKSVELDCNPSFTKFLTDFERAEMDAIAAVFGREKV